MSVLNLILCESADIQDFLDSGGGEGFPDAGIMDYDEPSFVDLGYCQSGSRSVEVTNTGSEFTAGFGAMIFASLTVTPTFCWLSIFVGIR